MFVRKQSNRAYEAFNRWFTSRGGVWETLIACSVIVLLEQTGVIHDKSGFWLLYYLTVYSAITQPALAASARNNEERSEGLLRRLEQKEELDAALLTKAVSILEDIASSVRNPAPDA